MDEVGLAMPSGGAAAYRREALTEVGSFDECLFAYHEDVDLGLRLRSAGWTCAAAADAIGVHLGSATIGQRSRWQVEVAGASRAYLLRKYGVLHGRPVPAASAVAVELAVTLAELVIGRDLAALRGRRDGWRRAKGRQESIPRFAVNSEIGFLDSLRRRRGVV
jgi:GT2 family glycosyltransferase